MTGRPPRIAEALFKKLLRTPDRDFILGDLAEEFAHKAASGGLHARLWYWAQLVQSIRPSVTRHTRNYRAPRKEKLLDTRKGRRLDCLDSLRQDVQFAFRQLRQYPGFTVVVVLTLALGIGANTAIFSIVHATLFEGLPYPEADRLVYVSSHLTRANVPATHIADADFFDMQQLDTVELASIEETVVLPLTLDDRSETVVVSRPTWNLFDVLDVAPVLGRVFAPQDAVPLAEDTWRDRPIILSYDVWQRWFGGDPTALGTSVRINGAPGRVVGVMPETFRLHLPPVANIGSDIDVWIPVRYDYSEGTRDGHSFRVVGRLRDGVTLGEARHEMSRLAADLRDRFEHHRFVGEEFELERLRDGVVGPVRGTLAVFLGAVGFVLLIACANVANLLMAKGTGRREEFAVRAALGAGRWRIVRQMLTESVVLALAGGLAGLVFATVAIAALESLRPQELPRIAAIEIDRSVLLFTLGVALLASLLYGLLPSVQYARGGLGQRTVVSSRSQRTLQTAIAVGEVALSIVLLAGALLMLRSFRELQEVPLGFEADRVVAFRTNTITTCNWTGTSFDCDRQTVEDELERRLAAIPGVDSVGIVFPLPMNGIYDRIAEYTPSSEREDERARREAYFRTLSPSYFETMDIELRSGRLFTTADNDAERDVPIVIVDEVLARKEWPGQNPVGQRIALFGWGFERPESYEVVGVVEYVPQWSHRDPRPSIYLPRKFYHSIEASVVVRTTSDPEALRPTIEREVARVSPDLPIEWVRLRELIAASMAPTRFVLTVLSVFSAMALILSAIGLYGVLSYSVLQRTREIGVRMAFGARTGHVVRDVVSRGIWIAGAGALLGLTGALALGGLLERHLFHVKPSDPLSLAGTTGVVFAIAIAACVVPAWRASRVDPVDALRTD